MDPFINDSPHLSRLTNFLPKTFNFCVCDQFIMLPLYFKRLNTIITYVSVNLKMVFTLKILERYNLKFFMR